MKRIIVAFSLAILSFAAFAGGTLKADDCAAGDIAAGKKVVVKGFTLTAPDKGLKVEDKSASPIKNGDVSYAKRIKMNGADGFVEFSAKAGEKISVVATSTSKDKAREIIITDNKNKKLSRMEAPAWNMETPLFTEGTFDVPEDGIYRVKGFGGGVYIFEISVN